MVKEAYVLVVDDDADFLGLMARRLEKAGYTVTTATDAWQQVVQVQSLKIGLVITDIMMPGASGADAVKHLRALPTVSPHLPVIFMTGIGLEQARRIIPQDPKIRLIRKPIDFEELRSHIRELTGLDRPL